MGYVYTSSLVDQPTLVSDANSDKLNMKAYGGALVEFIENAQSPLTIALQGEWGSGKTSLMNALKQELVSKEEAHFYGVWINTWQYSLLANPAQAILSILSAMVEEISRIAPRNYVEGVKKAAWAMSRIGSIAAGNILGKVIGAGDIGSEIAKSVSANGTVGDSEYVSADRNPIEELKNELQRLVNAAVSGSDKKSGVIFFVDDLDRIDPPVAVQILELLKNIFDLDKCIFVLAIDYGVVVKGLKSKFGEKTIANEREFRSFFDKIIQLPFSMPVGSYCIDEFLMESLAKIHFLDEEEAANQVLTKTLSSYAHESIGTNPRSIKRLVNSLSLMRLIVSRTANTEDDSAFKEWKDVVFALECIKIQYPQVHLALEKVPGFDQWGAAFAQTMGVELLSEEDREKLKVSQEGIFDEPWEQTLYALCKQDPFLESRALHISLILNQIKSRIVEEKQNVEDVIDLLVKLTAVTSVKSESTSSASDQPIYMPDALRMIRDGLLGMEWRETNDDNYYYGSALEEDISAVSWQRRLQKNLSVDFVRSVDEEYLYRSDFCLSTTMSFTPTGKNILFELWGEYRGDSEMGFDLTCPEIKDTLGNVEKTFMEIWNVFGVNGEIGHHEKNLWFNVSIPLKSLTELEDEDFVSKFRNAVIRMAKAFFLFKPFCVVKVQ